RDEQVVRRLFVGGADDVGHWRQFDLDRQRVDDQIAVEARQLRQRAGAVARSAVVDGEGDAAPGQRDARRAGGAAGADDGRFRSSDELLEAIDVGVVRDDAAVDPGERVHRAGVAGVRGDVRNALGEGERFLL